MRADRLEAEILGELFAAKNMAEEAEARVVRAAATRALSTLLRYRHRIQRDADRALAPEPLRPVGADPRLAVATRRLTHRCGCACLDRLGCRARCHR
jgi:hypothetical protein